MEFLICGGSDYIPTGVVGIDWRSLGWYNRSFSGGWSLATRSNLEFVMESVNFKENVIFKSDNKQVLQFMIDSSIKVNHCLVDPPYATGSNDFRYSDTFEHSAWEQWMQDLFGMVPKVLEDTGVCFVCIDDNNYAYLKVILDRVFGRKNYIGTFMWKKSHTVKNDSKTISTQHEMIIAYAKDISKVSFNRDRVSDEYINSAYRYEDEHGRFRTVPLYKNKNKNVFKIVSPSGVEWDKGWNYNPEGMKQLQRDGMIYWGKKPTAVPSKKVYLKKEMTKTFATWLDPKIVGYTGDGGKELKKLGLSSVDFLYAKPVNLFKHLLSMVVKNDDVVLDFFAGSGTTGQAIMKLNQEKKLNLKFVLVTNNENSICDCVTIPRISACIDFYNFDEHFDVEDWE